MHENRPQAILTWARFGYPLMPGSDKQAELLEHFERAVAHYKAGRLEDSIAEFKAAIKVDSRHAPSHYNLALRLEARGNYSDAVAAFEDFLACANQVERRYEPAVLARIALLKNRRISPAGSPTVAPRTRHLTVVFTDIQGFTDKTSHRSRVDIVRLLDTHRAVVLPVFQAKGGRLIKTIGDAFLLVFESPTDAVLAGLAVQSALARRNASVPEQERIQIRVAINSGEVTLLAGDVFGEAVNIASRIEGVAEVGEVYFTEAVYLAMNKTEVPSSEVGLLQLKGIPEKIRVYKVVRETQIGDGMTSDVVGRRPSDTHSTQSRKAHLISAPSTSGPQHPLDFLRLAKEPKALVGRRIGSYVVKRALGSGGSGLVYEAWNAGLGRQVCLKVLYPARERSEVVRAAVARSARALASLQHPNLIRVFDFGPFELGGVSTSFLAMELIDGRPIDEWSKMLALDQAALAKRFSAARALAAALLNAHESRYLDEGGVEQVGILHGDLKPANILVRPDGTPVVVDFMTMDVQRFLERGFVPEDESRLGITDAFGTPGFMAPEQEADGILTARCDVFGLGMTLAHVFFPIEGWQEIHRQSKGVEGPLKALLREMTEISPANRPATMAIVGKRLDEAAKVAGLRLGGLEWHGRGV